MSFSSFSNLLPETNDSTELETYEESSLIVSNDLDNEEIDYEFEPEVNLEAGQFALQYGIEDPIVGNVEDSKYSTLREAVSFYQERLGIMTSDLERLSVRQNTSVLDLDTPLQSGAFYTISIGHNRKG